MALLEFRQVYSGYGDVDILKGIDLTVDRGEMVAIIGPNGAGKSTVLKSLFGLAAVRAGKILFEDRDITLLRSDRLVRLGICYVPQTHNVFPTLSVQENLEMGAFIRKDDFRSQIDRIYELFPDLKTKRNQSAGGLSGGQRQMVAIGRALMVEPKLLLLDEPTAGLSPLFVDKIFETIRDINQLGIGILIVEHNTQQVLSMAHRGYVLALGKKIFEDTGSRLLTNPQISKMFLGG